jgi:DNA-binding NarL/FixJ family response regulator
LQDGQSFVIAGLMDNRVTDIYNKIPGLGDIPILGNFFRSKSLQKSNSELMVLCTVHRISPSNGAAGLAQESEAVCQQRQVRQEQVGREVAYGKLKRRFVMPELSVVIVATDNEQRAVLQVLVDGTSVARTVHTCASFPVAAADPVTRRVRAANPDVTLVDIPADNPPLALRSIELLHQEMPDASIFAIGTLNQPQVIVNAMRAGAREFIERPTNTTDLIDAFVRLQASQRRGRQEGIRGKVFSVINAKGGNGATTVAVNLALALQSAYGQTALVDMAPLGHAALHMNLKPVFNVADATRNLHRMDAPCSKAL